MLIRFRKKILTAATETHPLTLRLLHILLPPAIAFLLYAPVRYLLFEPHILGLCLYYREVFLYALTCLVIIIGGALLTEIAMRDRDS